MSLGDVTEYGSLIEAVRAFHSRVQEQPSITDQIRPLAGGMNNAVYAVETSGGPVCCKVYRMDGRDRAGREWRALNLLAKLRPGLAPEPLYFDPLPEQPAVVMGLVPGSPLRGGPITPAQFEELSIALQAVADITPEAVDYPDTVIGTPGMVIQRLEGWLKREDVRESGTLYQARLAIERWLRSDDRTFLEDMPLTNFSRGDSNLANALWDGERVRFVDLEYAGWSDLAHDLADIMEGIWARELPDDEWLRFVASFNLSPSAMERFDAARRMWALHWIVILWRRVQSEPAAEGVLPSQTERALGILASNAK